MGKNKQARFRENETFALLHQPDFMTLLNNDYHLKGRWHSDFFKNDNPITLELGCGRGEYTATMAQMFPTRNFIGIDIKGARLWRGAKTATEAGLPNVAFVRTKIETATSLFAPNEISEIWLTFPDPQPTRWKKRLCSSQFLNRYRQFMTHNGTLHLKTDCRVMHDYAKALLAHNGITPTIAATDLYAENSLQGNAATSIQTAYEKLFVSKGYAITYLQFALPADKPLVEPADFEFDKNVPVARRVVNNG
ncbi:tRNA (guanine-N(7)-)-methyltransferase [Bacteroidia bacterium]|nr:tRNA (guanine-N(7)-)-methyltransferase [Bacteroidia bacterium]